MRQPIPVKPCQTCGKAFKGNRRSAAFCSKKCSVASRWPALEERFWAKVNKSGPIVRSELGPCWLWTAAKTKDGYGQFSVNYYSYPRMENAQRVSWRLAHGPVPGDMSVLHKCDNPPCVNPGHLFLGTQLENIADMCRKDRQSRGRERRNAKLCPCAVRAMRALHADGVGRAEIARRFGCGATTVLYALRGDTWKHVA